MLPWQQNVSAAAAFLAGIASFVSPCVLPLVPVYLGVLTGETAGNGEEAKRARLFLSGLLFVVGFSSLFVAMGASASALGQWLIRYTDVFRVISGVLAIGMGLFAMGVLRLPFLMQERRAQWKLPAGVGYLRPLLLGVGFGFGWTPCVGPVLTSVLMLAAHAGSIARGVGLLCLYSLGLGLPFLVLAALGNALIPRLKKLNRHLPLLQRVGGALLIVMGLLLLSGQMEKFATLGGALL